MQESEVVSGLYSVICSPVDWCPFATSAHRSRITERCLLRLLTPEFYLYGSFA
jgi:hypothetical protein